MSSLSAAVPCRPRVQLAFRECEFDGAQWATVAPQKRKWKTYHQLKLWTVRIETDFLQPNIHFAAFFSREASMKSEKREKEERKSKKENTRLRR